MRGDGETIGPQLARELKGGRNREGKENGPVRLQEFLGLGKPLLRLTRKWAANLRSLESTSLTKCVEVITLNFRFLLLSHIKIHAKFYVYRF